MPSSQDISVRADNLSIVLHALMQRPTYRVTPGLLSKLSGIPRATIVNWLEGRVTKPRHSDDLLKVADALRLSKSETEQLLAASDHPPLATLRENIAPAQSRQFSRLPNPITELIGRARAVDAIQGLIRRAETRLVTLVGTGGVGKTHLAIAAAAGLRETFPDGIIWVSLAGTDDPSQVVSAIAQAVGIIETNATSALRLLATALSDDRALIVIDNFEQVLTAAPHLVELLERTANVKILLTSRASLHVRGEREFRVPPLDLPDLSHLPAIEVLAEHSAIALFVARAQAYQDTFELTVDNAADIAAICVRVDGLPLGLELAAAKTGLLSPTALLHRLDDRLTFLSSGPRDVSERQQTLKNTIAWSYALLTDEQRCVFRHLAILTGGISTAAAAAVANVDVSEPASFNAFFDVLASLVDQSLLSMAEPTTSREPRFVMLETIREYALEALNGHDEIGNAKVRHAAYFLALAEQADAVFSARPTALSLQHLQPEHANLLAGLKWLLEEAGDVSSAARFAAALSRYWFDRGLFRESRSWLDRVTRAGHAADAVMAARIKLYLAFVSNYESDYVTGALAAQEAFDAYTEVGDPSGAAHASNAMGVAAMFTGRYDDAEALFSRALKTYRDLGEQRGIAVALHNLGEIASECRMEFTAARSYFEESLDLFRELGQTMNVGSTLGVFAEMFAHQGQHDQATRLGREALATFENLDNRPLIARELGRLARYELAMNNDSGARDLLMDAVAHLRMSFNPRDIAYCFETFGELALRLGRAEPAIHFLGFSDVLRERHQIPRMPAWEHDYERAINGIRSSVSASLFGTYWDRGYNFELSEAIEEAGQL